MIRSFAVAVALGIVPAAAQNPALDAGPVLQASGFEGFGLVARGDTILWQTPRAACPPTDGAAVALCHPRDPAFRLWPWASVTKQVMAALTMTEVDRGRIALDAPVSRYLAAFRTKGQASPTVRQLLQHRAGLRNPDDTPKDADGEASWYTTGPTGPTGPTGLTWCLAGRTVPGGPWRYNNCDTLVLGAILEQVSGRSVATLFRQRIAKPFGLEATRFASEPSDRGRPEPAVAITAKEYDVLARFGAAGGLIGTPLDLLKFDRALLAGTLMTRASRDAMWRGDPALGYMGLAQWSFDAPLKGCAKTVRIIERRGGIGRFQVRNILLPDRDIIVMLFTADASFDFGEIWQGKGLSHDLLSQVACA